MKEDNLKLILLCLILFTISRLSLIFFSPYVFYPEEYKTGSLGYDIVFNNDLRMPLFGYLDSPHAGGSLLAQIEVIPFYILFGNKYISIKMAAILNSMIVFLIGLYFMNKYFSKLEIILFSLFYILGSPYFLQHNVIIQGNDFLFLIFLMLSLWLALTLLVEKKKAIRYYALLGFILGFGFWVQYGMILMIIPTLTFIMIKKKFNLNKSLVFGIFLFLGLLPWLIYNLEYNWPSIFSDIVLYKKNINIGLNELSERISLFFTLHLPRSFHFIDLAFIPARIFDYLFYLGITLIIILSLKYLKKEKRKSNNFTFIIIFYLLTFIFLFNFLNFPIGNDFSTFNSMNIHHEYYLLMFHPFLIFLSAISFSLFLKHSRKYGVVLLCGISFIMIIGYYTTLTPPKFNNYLLLPAHSTEMLAFEAGSNYILSPPTFRKFYNDIKEDSLLRENYMKGGGLGIIYLLETKKPAREEIKEIISNNMQILDINDKKNLFLGFIKGDEILESPPTTLVKPTKLSINTFTAVLSAHIEPVLSRS